MTIPLPRQVSSRRAAEILRRLFGHLSTGCAFRLWDGTTVVLGRGEPVCTAVVHRPETFIRLMRAPTPLTFAEAYVEGAIDLEGDLFRAMSVADSIEEMKLSFTARMRTVVDLWRG